MPLCYGDCQHCKDNTCPDYPDAYSYDCEPEIGLVEIFNR